MPPVSYKYLVASNLAFSF